MEVLYGGAIAMFDRDRQFQHTVMEGVHLSISVAVSGIKKCAVIKPLIEAGVRHERCLVKVSVAGQVILTAIIF